MKQLTKDKAVTSMSSGNPAVLKVAPGEEFCLETEDCYAGRIVSPNDPLPENMEDFANPATGPVFVDGANLRCVELVHPAERGGQRVAGSNATLVHGLHAQEGPFLAGGLVLVRRSGNMPEFGEFRFLGKTTLLATTALRTAIGFA